MTNENITIAGKRNLTDVDIELTLKYMEKHSLDYNALVGGYKVFYKTAVECEEGKYNK